AEAELRRRTNAAWLDRGVTMVDPAATYIDASVELGADVTLFPGTILQGHTRIGDHCEIGPDARLVDTVVGSDCFVRSTFANGEIKCQFGESVRGSDVFIIQSHFDPINDSIMEQLIMIDAAKRGSAKRITAVCPYYGYSRQDRKAEGRDPITAKLLANMLVAAGANRMVSVALHSAQIQGFFDKPVDHLIAMPVLLDYLNEEGASDVVIVSPDAGRIKVAERYAQHLHADLAFVYKTRPKGTGTVEAREVIGDVEGRRCVL